MVVVVIDDEGREEWRIVSLHGETRIACPGIIRSEFQSHLRLAVPQLEPVSDLAPRPATHRRVMLNLSSL
jgi:hypothetical protein